MKKRIFGTVLAAALIVTQAVAAFAAPSKTTTPNDYQRMILTKYIQIVPVLVEATVIRIQLN